MVFCVKLDGKSIYSYFYQFVEQLEYVNFEFYGLLNVDYLLILLCVGLVSQGDFVEYLLDELLLCVIEVCCYVFNNNYYFCNVVCLKV